MVYLDNSATTKPSKTAVEYMNNTLLNSWGNPSSLHRIGIEAEVVLESARKAVAGLIKAKPGEIVFTGSGTEANNTALMSVEDKKRGNRIITTEIEHPSVLEAVKRLETLGFEVVRLKPQKGGVILPEQVTAVLNDKTLLVSVMLVNNEIGTIQPIAEIVKSVKEKSPDTLVHCDAVQGLGKLTVNVKKLGVDLLTGSAHKIHAPKGIGFLYIKKGVKIKPYILGGGQESGMRSGTQAVQLAAAFEGAVKDLGDLQKNYKNAEEIKNYAADLFEKSGFIKVNSPEGALPYIINISVPGYKSETLLHFLEMRDIFVSSGSACAKGKKSYVLESLGLNSAEIDSALRISISRENTKDDIDALYGALCLAVKQLRKA